MQVSMGSRVSLVGMVLLAAASGASAQYASDFEPETYALGNLTNGFGGGGQDGWFNPVSGSNDFAVQNYGSNPQGFVQNPSGGLQFAYGALVTNLGRAQHNVTINATSLYRMSFDQAVLDWNGQPPNVAQNNISSFSLQNSATDRSMQSLATWQDVNNPAAGWQQQVGGVDAAGTGGHVASFFNIGAAWQNLLTNHWYRFTFDFNMSNNQIVAATITDLHTNATTSEDLTDNNVYLTGGAGNALGYTLPTAFRMFAGGGSGAPASAGNRDGFDNVSLTIVPAPGAATLLGLGLFAGLRRRRA